ncbi:MAG: hypothetical protein G01um101438_939 [Parcubacteria group bacterium Gr01-1014_38]|nr:MAG: hypothetical protein G01um101438_939 [Parcubacteria group bacterium Gr01-1014_38]
MSVFAWLAVLALALAAGAGISALFSTRKLRVLEERLERLGSGKDGRSLEQTIRAQDAMLKKHSEGITELVKASEYLHRALQAAIRKVSFERYNPFPGIGGNLSFTLVMLDAHNTGVVITSLHNRDATRVYAKAVRDGQPLQQLSEEEERVLRNATTQKGA